VVNNFEYRENRVILKMLPAKAGLVQHAIYVSRGMWVI